jgi:hypothetical protein
MRIFAGSPSSVGKPGRDLAYWLLLASSGRRVDGVLGGRRKIRKVQYLML